jgi:replication factor C subunit 1
MDEVDGMAGNEDRGGIQELIQLIKSSRVPVICMCNDRHHPKIRSLTNYCFDLQFSRPNAKQILVSCSLPVEADHLKVLEIQTIFIISHCPLIFTLWWNQPKSCVLPFFFFRVV